MRARRPSDWVVDLSARHDIEEQVAQALTAHPALQLVRNSTSAFDRLDFQVVCADQLVEVEVKAKRQPLSLGWQTLRPDVTPENLFVMDELALRKIVDAGRYAFLLVRDLPAQRWCLWSAGDLLVASRARHARQLDTPSRKAKGKLLFDLSEAGQLSASLDEIVNTLSTTVVHLDGWWRDIAPWPAQKRATSVS
jgi:hypothetical protein